MTNIKKNSDNVSLIAEEFKSKINEERRKARITDVAPLFILILLIISMSILVDGFFTKNNLINILFQMSTPLVLSVGLTFVIILGSIDLSVEGVIGFTGSFATILVANSNNSNNWGIWGVLIAIVVGSLAGTLTGVLHVKLKIPSFMVTFGMASIMTGVGILTYMGHPASIKDPNFSMLSHGFFIGIPYLTWFALIIFFGAYIIQEYTSFGRHIYAIGENETVLRVTGINVDKIKILVFTWCAFCASIAGIFGIIRLGRGEVTIGTGYLFSTITAVAVGGTALWGGRGGVIQSLIGVLIVTVIKSSLILEGVNPYIQSAVQGLLIIIAVALTVVRGRRIIVK